MNGWEVAYGTTELRERNRNMQDLHGYHLTSSPSDRSCLLQEVLIARMCNILGRESLVGSIDGAVFIEKSKMKNSWTRKRTPRKWISILKTELALTRTEIRSGVDQKKKTPNYNNRKMKFSIVFILVSCLLYQVMASLGSLSKHQRSKRAPIPWLIYPTTSPTRVMVR